MLDLESFLTGCSTETAEKLGDDLDFIELFRGTSKNDFQKHLPRILKVFSQLLLLIF